MMPKPEGAKYEVAVVGLGYVGIPLAIGFATAGCRTLGVDSDAERVEILQSGKSPLPHLGNAKIATALSDRRVRFSAEKCDLAESEAIIICVPTPIRSHNEPDLGYVLSAAGEIAPWLRQGMLVCLESSTYPGTTGQDLREVLESMSGLKAGEDFHLAFSPEREDPGNNGSVLHKMPKVIGGYTEGCLSRALELYERVVEHPVPVSSCETAEAVKLTENIFRFVNIALINELKRIYSAMDIDIWEVVEAAKTKPFGYMPFYPGVGVGGHCIPVDPFYLTWKAREYNLDTRFIELAGQINRSMPYYAVNHLLEALNARKRSLRGSRILVLGVAYKPGISDDRESPSYRVMDLLRQKGAEVGYYDPYVPEIDAPGTPWHALRTLEWNRGNLAAFDAAIVCTAHREIDYKELADVVPLVVDACNAVPKNRVACVVPA
jgi:UDP-N-acetyl-D-glucosamine dehydrogenase